MLRHVSVFIAITLYFAGLTVAIAEDHGKWVLEQRRDFIFSLSYKQSASINDETKASEFALLCDQKIRVGIVGAILIPYDGTFEGHQNTIPVSIQKRADEYDQSDLLQKWKNGSEYIFLDVADDLADLIALLKERGAESDSSVHFYFPNGLDTGQQSSGHIVIDAAGFADKFRDFENGCASPQ